MADAHAPAGKYYVPHESKWPIIASASFFTLLLGAICLLNDWLPAWAMVPGFALVVFMFIGWFGTVIGENQRGHLRPRRRPLVPHGNDVVHLLRGDVLRGVLRRAVLRARAVGAVAGRRRHQVHRQPAAAPGVRERLAHQRPGEARPARQRHVRNHSGVRPAGDQHAHPADLGRHRDHRAPRAACRQSRRAQHLPGPDLPARASRSSTCRPPNTTMPTTSWACSSAPASTARRSSCSPASTVST